MPQTRYVFIGVSLLIGVLVVVLISTLVARVPTGTFSSHPELQLATPRTAVLIEDTEQDERLMIRESLRARLLASNGRSVTVTEEETSGVESPTPTLPEPEPILSGLPLGVTRMTSTPTEGIVYTCASGDAVTPRKVPWVQNGRWYPDERPTVDGFVFLDSSVLITSAEGARILQMNSVPVHSVGEFPVAPTDDAYPYRGSEATPKAQSFSLQIPLNPQILSSPKCIGDQIIGVAKNGVLIYSARDTHVGDTGAMAVVDRCGGATDAQGTYHYVRESACLVDAYYEGGVSTLLGYALDGFGIFASIENGRKLTNTELDECHGHTHEIPWNGETISKYHYHMTDEYPYSVGCFRGTPASMTNK